MSFVFSADGHAIEPTDLFDKNMPSSLLKHGLRTEKRGNMLLSLAGEAITMQRSLEAAPPRLGPDGEPFGRPDRRGNREIEWRRKDMALDGVDGEIVFPSVGLTNFRIEHPEAEYASAQIYNDWINGLLAGHLEIFVRCGVLPVRDFKNTVAEMERLARLGFTSAMLPSRIDPKSGLPTYQDAAWDTVFDAAQRLDLVLVLHTGTGRYDIRGFRGPGGAVMNHTIQACDGMETIMAMVASGLLDRFPKVQVCCIESGASWLAALAERMDEVYLTHEPFVRPKLSVLPGEIVARQVTCAFQYDRACIMSRSVTGTKAMMWGADYPHHEGTFPRSKEILAHLFDGIDITESEKADIIGLNGARLFRLPNPAVLAAVGVQ
jgi:predicted TIM-barrel fold metal-dependent hydrolase